MIGPPQMEQLLAVIEPKSARNHNQFFDEIDAFFLNHQSEPAFSAVKFPLENQYLIGESELTTSIGISSRDRNWDGKEGSNGLSGKVLLDKVAKGKF